MRNFGRLFGTFVVTVLIGGLAVGACFAALVPGTVDIVTAHKYSVHQVKELRGLSERTTIYWADGSVMGHLGLKDREPVTLDQVPKRIQDAVIATEDRTFWTNDGIDLGAVFRAFLTNVVSGEINQGGSTITQQLVKNRILTTKRDVNRKIREIEDALRLNEKFSKEKILEEYLNTVYFGQGSYGIAAAARRFFLTTDPIFGVRGKSMDELTIGEAALLAGVIQSPSGNDPFVHPDVAIRRRADVLRAEVDQGYIKQEEADAANNEPLPTVKPDPEQRPTNYLVAEVQDRLLQDPRLGSTEKERSDKLLKGGLKVYTTFDPRLQRIAEDVTANASAVQRLGEGWEASLVSIEPSTGMVKAMVGGPDFGVDQYNIATHPIGRQPGSTWKVITLAAALANGYSPHDTVDGSQECRVPSQFPGADQFTINAEPSEGGVMDLFEATANSVNCAFVRLSTSVGQDTVINTGKAMGLTQDTLKHLLTLSIGTIEATPLEMATVMATIANLGVHQTPIFVSKVLDSHDIAIVDDTTRPGDVALSSDVAACEQTVLRGVVQGGTGGNANVAGHTVYGKTGTTDDRTDAWFVGATPKGAPLQLATSVWFGYRASARPGAGFGGDSAAPIFRDFMSQALDGVPDLGLPAPGPVCARPGAFVNPDGGHGAPPPPVVAPSPTPAPTPTVAQLPTTPAAPAVPNTTRPPGTLPSGGGGG
ncbi:MAG TPA: transglycosylase domain-containing protein [Acidimicrobiia bacterium]|nr:transglycosylase domain-containing protein [Acidimicrobiia bacterium]